MIQERKGSQGRSARWGWGMMLLLSAGLTLNGIGIYFFIADTQLLQTAGILELGVGLLALGLAWEGFRRGSRWAWTALWALVAVLAALSIHILIGGEGYVGIWYLSLTLVALVGQLLAGSGLAE